MKPLDFRLPPVLFRSIAVALLCVACTSCDLFTDDNKWAVFDHAEPPSGSTVATGSEIRMIFDQPPEITQVRVNGFQQHFVPGQLSWDGATVIWAVAAAYQDTEIEIAFEWVASPYRSFLLSYTVR